MKFLTIEDVMKHGDKLSKEAREFLIEQEVKKLSEFIDKEVTEAFRVPAGRLEKRK